MGSTENPDLGAGRGMKGRCLFPGPWILATGRGSGVRWNMRLPNVFTQIFMKYGRQRWKLKGKIEVNGKQSWDGEETVFLPLIVGLISIKVPRHRCLLLLFLIAWPNYPWVGTLHPTQRLLSVQSLKDGRQSICNKVTFYSYLCFGNKESIDCEENENGLFLLFPSHLLCQVTELKGLATHILVGSVTCETKELFAARPQVVAVDINDLGTIKLNLEITW